MKDITTLNSYRKSLPFNNASELHLRVSPLNNANKSYLSPDGELSKRFEFRDSQDFGSQSNNALIKHSHLQGYPEEYRQMTTVTQHNHSYSAISAQEM